ncbi:MAG: MSCRAMM family adhesin SdrC [candidate division WOR-3 bacterium]|nr:MSCRAMM family adhesin SdrC [candidate division WOR-3 bacterium]
MIIIFFIITVSRLNTSFYSYQKLGAYAINDLYIGYLFSKYELNFTFEKRPDDYGIKSLSIGIDSVFGNNRLILGEKYYNINGPLSATLPLWGAIIINRNFNLFFGKSKDYTTSLPPAFTQNNYTFGFKLFKNLSFKFPVELIFLKKSDAMGIVKNNNYLGANTGIKFSDKFQTQGQWALNLSEFGLGSALAIKATFTEQKYGTDCSFRKVFKNFVSPSNLLSESINWFQVNNYLKPLTYFSITQNLTYSSLYDLNTGLNFVLNKHPLPDLGYGLGFSFKSNILAQHFHAGYRFKEFSIDAGYDWSVHDKSTRFRMTQDIKNFQAWMQIQIKNDNIYQLGCSFFLSPDIKMKTFLNIMKQQDFKNMNTGIDLSLKLLRNLSLNTSYELIKYDKSVQHTLSLNVSNTFLFEETGFSFITGRVFMDINNNGIFDTGDEVIPGIEVLLNGRESTKTDKNGNYRFSFVPPGDHTLSVKFGCIPAEFGTEKRKEKITTRFLTRQRLDFPMGKLGFIEGAVFYDDNKNNHLDPDEKGIPNVVLGLNGFLTTSDEQGRFRFANLISGTYILDVKILPQETYLASTDLVYIHIKPGEGFKDFNIPVLKRERATEKKIFKEPQIIKPKKLKSP